MLKLFMIGNQNQKNLIDKARQERPAGRGRVVCQLSFGWGWGQLFGTCLKSRDPAIRFQAPILPAAVLLAPSPVSSVPAKTAVGS